MKIIFRYIAHEYLRIFWLALGSLVLIYVVGEVFVKIGKFAPYQADAGALAAYFALRIPRAVYDVLPLAALMASLLAMTTLSRQHEITALRACGVGIGTIAAPVLVVSLTLAVAAFAANWSWIPEAGARAQAIKSQRIEGRTSESTLRRTRIWMRLEQRLFLNVRMADPARGTLYGVHVYQVGDDFSLTQTIDAPEVRYRGGSWTALNGIARVFRADGSMSIERFAEYPLDLVKTPEDFIRVEVKEEYLAYPQLRDYVEELRRTGIDPGRYAVDEAARTSVPFIVVVMALIGIPFGLGDSRRGGWGTAVGLSLLTGLAYWILHSLAISLGRGGSLPPWIAAWAANGIFLTIG
ncbi:MAG: LPS export ABC transporter permease LptG, partial [Nitrospiria bacterium]